jgi:6-phosphogluconolactonase (cycloisomerase 2 family)
MEPKNAEQGRPEMVGTLSTEWRVERRKMLVLGLLAATQLVLHEAQSQAADTGKPTYLYVGSYTKNPPGGGSNNPIGLSVFRFNPQSGALIPVQQVPSTNPSFVALDPSKRFLYVINEIGDYEGKKSGSIEAYSINPNAGTLKFLNRQPLNSPGPAHLAVDPTGRYVVVAIYGGGEFVALPIEPDGRLGAVNSVLKDSGTGPNKSRQDAPHPHSVVFDPNGRFVAAADLGIDKVQILRLGNGVLERVSQAPVAPGAGPRHLAFSRDGKVLYVIDEINATITVFAYDPAIGKIGQTLQTISTEPPGYSGPHSTAEIAVHPSGKFLYGSNRGAQSIVGYRIDASTGKLSVIGYANQGVNYPRNFVIDPSGKWLYVANQNGDSIVQFEINPETGELRPTGQATASITPVAMVFRTQD